MTFDITAVPPLQTEIDLQINRFIKLEKWCLFGVATCFTFLFWFGIVPSPYWIIIERNDGLAKAALIALPILFCGVVALWLPSKMGKKVFSIFPSIIEELNPYPEAIHIKPFLAHPPCEHYIRQLNQQCRQPTIAEYAMLKRHFDYRTPPDWKSPGLGLA